MIDGRRVLRELARRVAEAAAEPRHLALPDLWRRHNGLRQERAMLLVYPEDAWDELVPASELACAEPVDRTYEWFLRRLLYRHERIPDDFIVTRTVNVPVVARTTGWGLEPQRRLTETSARGMAADRGVATPFALMHEFCRVFAGRPSHGSYAIEPVLREESDLERMRQPEVVVDDVETARIYDRVASAIGDILEVRLSRAIDHNLSLIGTLNSLRGIEQVMYDMVERPAWVHAVMERMTNATLRLLEDCEARGLLDLNNREHYVGSGGIGWTDELPAADHAGRVRTRDLWGFATMQSATFISPEMQAEFVLPYQGRLLERFGLNCHGCCEALTARNYGMVRAAIPRLRRVSVSPFTDAGAAADFLGRDVVYSWKPNPALVQVGGADLGAAERELATTVERTRGLELEVVLKDIVSLHGRPDRVERWVAVARRVLEAR